MCVCACGISVVERKCAFPLTNVVTPEDFACAFPLTNVVTPEDLAQVRVKYALFEDSAHSR